MILVCPTNKRELRFTMIGLAVCLLSFVTASGQGVKVDLPSGVNGTTLDLASSRNPIVIVSVTTSDQFYLGNDQTPENQLGFKMGELLKQTGNRNPTVYIAAGVDVNYGSIVKVMKIIRDQDVGAIGLLVRKRNTGEGVISYVLIEIPVRAKPNDDLTKLKPNPLTLMASISSELQLTLNGDSGPEPHELCFRAVPHGLGKDPGNLEKWLACLFEYRTKQHAYKIGMETRGDIPEPQRIEKTVFINASRSIRYGDVIRVVDAVKGAGANPIGLKIDDLPQ